MFFGCVSAVIGCHRRLSVPIVHIRAQALQAVLSSVEGTLLLVETEDKLSFFGGYNALNFGVHRLQALDLLGLPSESLSIGPSSFQYLAKKTGVDIWLL